MYDGQEERDSGMKGRTPFGWMMYFDLPGGGQDGHRRGSFAHTWRS